MAWGIKRRLVFIETRLFWDGQINRKDLVDFFKISTPQASGDLKMYAEEAPNNIEYDSSAKVFVIGKNFKPKYISCSSSEYFAQLLLAKNKELDNNDLSESFLQYDFPDFATIEPFGRSVNPVILKKLISVIKNQESIEICYQSLKNPDPEWRWLAPHAFGFDGFRWHLRAYCYKSKKFKDFVLGRILDTGDKCPADITASSDLAWNHIVEFIIVPHPGLSENQKKAIAIDYAMVDQKAIHKLRAAFIFYALQRFGIDKDQLENPAERQQVVLENINEIINMKAMLENMTYETQR